MTFLILAPLFLSQLVAGDFSYEGSHGPSHWGVDYKTCLGKYQSPIDIEEKDVTIFTFPTLKFSNIQNSHTAFMKNNGHTVMIQSTDSNLPTISGGPINDTYVFQQLHFHWGPNDNVGSEDLINNHSYAMELHAVFYKESYGSSEEAMKHPDGLTVLGYLYEAEDKPNPVFETIVPLIPDITEVGSNVTINDSNVLNKLIAPDIASAQSYYTYKGSLTTPPCYEIVQWIDFIQPQPISHEQLAVFRSIQSSDGKNLTHNYRPVQPLDDRVIYRNSINETTNTSPATSTMITTEKNTPKDVKPTDSTSKTSPPGKKNGQEGIWGPTSFTLILGALFFMLFE
ncbi:carbonic anhydrase 2 [Calliopsis andreniformis]|uniref:carbonic anhydrase 2 n=1 Tax=Calliopsis andreniformis TaxID=337506 RepID=UPI003FCCCD6D